MRLLAQQNSSQNTNEEGVGSPSEDDSDSENVGSLGEEESYETSQRERAHRFDRRRSTRLQVQFKENDKQGIRQKYYREKLLS